MKLNTLGVLSVLLVGGLATGSLAAGRPTAFIQKIVVKGNTKVSRSQITRIVGVKPGEGFDPDRIRPGVRRLYETHQFRDVKALREAGTASDSVIVIIEVVEFPRVDACA
jgi:outer membrane protein assembly factor BamA